MSAPPKVSVLIVAEDAAVLAGRLRQLDCAAEAIASATAAAATLAARRCDLLLVDIVMPNSVNGLALARMARLRRRDLKVVYVSGYNIPGVEDELLGPILRKPIDDRLLIEEIEKVLAA